MKNNNANKEKSNKLTSDAITPTNAKPTIPNFSIWLNVCMYGGIR